jgi:AcrR family transcriptional regulator
MKTETTKSTRRMRSPERKAQIVQIALRLIGERGIKGTTLEDIASAAGVTRAALYAHFSGKREIMLAALDVLFAKIEAIHKSVDNPNALERLEEICLLHTRLLGSQREGFVFPLFEFMAAPIEEGLREELRARHLVLVDDIARIVREGQAQGTIDGDADPYQTAWLITSRSWTEDVATLIGATGPEEWTQQRSKRMLALILQSITTKTAVAS